MKKLLVSLLLCLSLSLSACGKTSVQQAQYVQNEVIVQLTPSKHRDFLIDKILKKFGHVIKDIKPFVTDSKIIKITVDNTVDIKKLIKEIEEIAGVKSADPNYIVNAIGLPNDERFTDLWGLKNTGQTDAAGQVGKPGSDINVIPVWELGFTGSKQVVVAVIDTGVQWDHPDLKDNLWENPGEAGDQANDSKDNDGNGFVDDQHGWNFNAKNRNSSDDHGHGSHCSGTIGGRGDNKVGVAGVNWEVKIMPLKFLSSSGSGSTEDAVEAINYATKMGAHIMSNSWGGGGSSQVLEDAIKNADKAGILFIAAAGNEAANNDKVGSFPANYQVPNVISVAATDNQDKLASFSSYGKTKVHVAAPGVKIWSTVKGGGYAAYSGTSMATPHVAGAAALLKSIHPEWSVAEIKDRLIRTSTPVKALKNKSVSKGRINVHNALTGFIPPTTEPDESKWQEVEFKAESKHPYDNNTSQTIAVEFSGAKYIKLHFTKLDLESGYDKLSFKDESGATSEDLTGSAQDYWSEYIEGSKGTLVFKADNTVNKWGFAIDKAKVIY